MPLFQEPVLLESQKDRAAEKLSLLFRFIYLMFNFLMKIKRVFFAGRTSCPNPRVNWSPTRDPEKRESKNFLQQSANLGQERVVKLNQLDFLIDSFIKTSSVNLSLSFKILFYLFFIVVN
jgi:hypothetical protein